MRFNSVKEFEKSVSGGEPFWNEKTKMSMSQALNWYNYHSDYKESKKFTLQYMKELKLPKKDIELIEKVDEKEFQNLGFVCRMKLRGFKLSERNETWITNFFSKLKRLAPKPVVESKKEETRVFSIQDRILEKSREYVGEIEGIIDDCSTYGDFTVLEPYATYQTLGVKGVHTNYIIKFFKKRLQELQEAYTGKDADLNVGYSFLKKKELKQYIELVQTIISDAEKLAHNTKVVRAPRKKKAKPVEKVISKLQFKKEDSEYKIASVNPSEIIGASQLWVFNTKLRKLGCYFAVDSGGLNVKGTTITNYIEETSHQKTVRKPEVIIPNTLKAGKVSLRKILPEINAVEQPLTGRITSDTILLRVIK